MVYDLAVASGVDITPRHGHLPLHRRPHRHRLLHLRQHHRLHLRPRRSTSSSAAPTPTASRRPSTSPTRPARFRLLGAALPTSTSKARSPGPGSRSTKSQRADAIVEDCEGIVNYLIGIAGVEAAVFLRELPPGDTAVPPQPPQQRRVDVAKVAETFGGGGHRNASGCTLPGPLDAATARILADSVPDSVSLSFRAISAVSSAWL